MIRPRPARWFEALVARDDATLALEALAATGAIELEAKPGASLPQTLADVQPLLAQFADLARAYRAYWPKTGISPSAFPDPPAVVLTRDLARIREWATDAEPAITELQAIASERNELLRWQHALGDLDGTPVPLDALSGDGKLRSARLIAFPLGVLPPVPEHTLMRPLSIEGEHHVLAVGPPQELDALAQVAAAGQGRCLAIPDWLHRGAQASLAHIASRLPALDMREAELRRTLVRLAEKHALGRALADASRLGWILENVHALESGEHFCFVTGWTSETRSAPLADALEACGARAILHFPPPPDGVRPPLLFANPSWARPFEIFARALGMPTRDEVDPSVLLAVTVPLLFGFMFGDIGQGLVIAILGFALRERYPIARLFIAGGVSAAVFGALFGSVFSLHLVDALWLNPLDRPLDVLVVPIVGGALLLAFGLLLAGLEAYWRGQFGEWLATDAALVVVYGGIVAGFLWPAAFGVATAAAVAFCAARALHAGRVAAAATAVAQLVERTLQLLINTLSFARVGAFALAHAGLSSAIVALMDAAPTAVAKGAVLVAGNLIVVLLETLVVSVQTTRLVLFEFFTRFLGATGRIFRPLPVPPSTT